MEKKPSQHSTTLTYYLLQYRSSPVTRHWIDGWTQYTSPAVALQAMKREQAKVAETSRIYRAIKRTVIDEDLSIPPYGLTLPRCP